MEANRTTSQHSSPTPTKGSAIKPVRPAARLGSGKSRRGFASMDPALQHRIATAGGKASHASGNAHQWTVEKAREAGRKGGLISRRKPSGNTPST